MPRGLLCAPIVPVGIGEREDHEVERQCRIVGEMDRQDVAALHGQFVEQPLGERAPLWLRRSGFLDCLDHTFVGDDLGLGVVLRDQCWLAIARED